MNPLPLPSRQRVSARAIMSPSRFVSRSFAHDSTAPSRPWTLQENRVLREQLNARVAFGSFVGASEKMRRVYRMIEKVGPRNYSVLLLGETGTGKELVARAVHSTSPRKNRPFVPV